MGKAGYTILLFIAATLCWSGPSFAQEKIERFAKGQINWTSRQFLQTVKAPPYPDASDDGEAQMGAELAAKQKLWRNYIELMANVRFNSSQSVHTFLENHQALKYRTRAMLRNYRQSGRRVLKDNVVEVASYFSLDQSFAQVLYSDLRTFTPLPASTPGGAYSGIIIDGRGLGLRPALLPKIRSGSEVIWDTLQADSLWEGGPLIYARDKMGAVVDRVGTKPLEIKAQSTYGALPVDVVIADEEAEKLRQAAVKEHLMAGRLVFLVD